MAKEIAKLHLLFRKADIKRGDKIALIGRNNTRWCITYIATITYGAVIVPILQDFAPNDVIHIINHSESKLLFLGDNFWDDIEEEQIPHVDAVFSLTDYHVIHERDGHTLTKYVSNIVRHYREAYPRGFGSEDIKYPDIPNDAVCLLNYTSGTTGSSKGVMLTVNNLTGNVLFALSVDNPLTGDKYFHRGGRTLSFLPLAHAYGCAFDFLTQLACGAHITLLGRIPSPKILVEAMQITRPTVICSVPLVLEKVYRKEHSAAVGEGAYEHRHEDSVYQYGDILHDPLAPYGAVRRVSQSVHRRRCRAQSGDRGVPAQDQIPADGGLRYDRVRPLISFSDHQDFKPGSCGKYLKGYLEAKIDSPDPENRPGELLVRGEHVMNGYYKNDKATKAVLTADGWLHTGDMCTMDADGTLYIRGRCKTMILSGSGQNIYPEEIEDKLNNMYMVLESLVVENNGKLTALVVPDYELSNIEGVDVDDLPKIMEDNLKQLNSQVASYERIANIVIYPKEFEKTPKRSIKRYLC